MKQRKKIGYAKYNDFKSPFLLKKESYDKLLSFHRKTKEKQAKENMNRLFF